MKYSTLVEVEWQKAFATLSKGDFFRSMEAGTFTLEHYKAFLQETFHNASLNPRIGSLFHVRMPANKSALMARFLKHNASEVGHNEMALADLTALGEDPESIRRSRPLPATEALAGFIIFQIEYRNPLAYLGYLYHLESLGTNAGRSAMGALGRLGIGPEALTFLLEHAEADVAHMQFNREYLDKFVETPEDLEAVLLGMQGSCQLYGLMLQGIMDKVGNANLESGVPAFETAAAR